MAEDTTQDNPAPPAAPPTDTTPPPAPPEPSADEKEWGEAVEDFSKDHGVVKEEPKKKDEPAKPKKEPKMTEPPKDDTKDKKPDEKPKSGDDTTKKTEDDKPKEDEKQQEEQLPDTPEVRNQRRLQREIAADEETMKADVRKEMFSEVPTELLDAEGDPIRSVEDVMKLQNPVTGEAFTQEEAAAWLMSATQHIAKQLDEVDQQVEQIAQANLDLKDWADNLRIKYGEFIKANPEIWKPIWDEYQQTLVKDEKTQIITKAPVNLESFAEVALAPHIKMAEQMQQDREKQQEQVEQKQKEEQDKQHKQTQSDRADITATGKSDTRNKDEKEWEAAAKEYYEGK